MACSAVWRTGSVRLGGAWVDAGSGPERVWRDECSRRGRSAAATLRPRRPRTRGRPRKGPTMLRRASRSALPAARRRNRRSRREARAWRSAPTAPPAGARGSRLRSPRAGCQALVAWSLRRSGRRCAPVHGADSIGSRLASTGTSAPLVTRYTFESTSIVKARGNRRRLFMSPAIRTHTSARSDVEATTRALLAPLLRSMTGPHQRCHDGERAPRSEAGRG